MTDTHASAGQRKSSHIRKGTPCVRRLLCEFAHAASRTSGLFNLETAGDRFALLARPHALKR